MEGDVRDGLRLHRAGQWRPGQPHQVPAELPQGGVQRVRQEVSRSGGSVQVLSVRVDSALVNIPLAFSQVKN